MHGDLNGEPQLLFLLKQLEEELGDRFDKFFIRRKCKKGTYLLKQGETSDNYFYLEQGGVAHVYIENEYVELTTGFIFPYEFGGCIIGSMLNQPACCTMKLLTDANVRFFSIKEYGTLKQEFTTASLLEELIVGSLIKQLFDRVNEFRYLTAKERYFWLIKTQPQLIKHIPAGYIAQYLGITSECLSRIRADVKSMPVFKTTDSTELILSNRKPNKK